MVNFTLHLASDAASSITFWETNFLMLSSFVCQVLTIWIKFCSTGGWSEQWCAVGRFCWKWVFSRAGMYSFHVGLLPPSFIFPQLWQANWIWVLAFLIVCSVGGIYQKDLRICCSAEKGGQRTWYGTLSWTKFFLRRIYLWILNVCFFILSLNWFTFSLNYQEYGTSTRCSSVRKKRLHNYEAILLSVPFMSVLCYRFFLI